MATLMANQWQLTFPFSVKSLCRRVNNPIQRLLNTDTPESQQKANFALKIAM